MWNEISQYIEEKSRQSSAFAVASSLLPYRQELHNCNATTNISFEGETSHEIPYPTENIHKAQS